MKQLLLTLAMMTAMTATAQTGADYMRAAASRADLTIYFNVADEGKEYKVNWGMDAAWDWDFNVNRGVAHIGKGNFATGRVSFQPVDLVTDNGDGTYTLTARQQKKLKWRCDLMKLTGTTKVNLNCDHEALFCLIDEDGNYPEEQRTDGKMYKITDYTGRTNYQGKPQEWYKLIKASVQFVQQQGLTVVSVSPFNEPDYVWEQAVDESTAMEDFLAIAKLLKADEFFKDIRICGGNTLNDDKALTWYNYLKDYLDEGNTHQLAGTFYNYANFFKKVKADGKVATADELHNVGEAIVGVNYGMENGIWWGFDSKARGQFCLDSNQGVRLGYGENRNAWTCGAVYRNNTTGEVHGYLGSSERQATTSTFAFVSEDRPVYFNGEGPTRRYVFEVPGGTGYQYGQINAERLFDITWGEDVPPFVVDGNYILVNQYSDKVLTSAGSSYVTTSTLSSSNKTSQQWKVTPGRTRGDISYWFIDNLSADNNSHLNILNSNMADEANVICWKGDHNGTHLLEEQWYIKYAQDGYYYIISRLSNKYLYCTNSASGSEVRLKTGPSPRARSKAAYLWRLQPIDSKVDTRSPAIPTELNIQQQENGIQLSWTAPEDTDPLTYLVLRAVVPQQEGESAEYNTIARGVSTTSFLDTTAEPSKHYLYKVKAVDYAGNRSEDSEELATSIESVVSDNGQGTTDDERWYDLSGKPASETTSGIILQGKKKVYRKQ